MKTNAHKPLVRMRDFREAILVLAGGALLVACGKPVEPQEVETKAPPVDAVPVEKEVPPVVEAPSVKELPPVVEAPKAEPGVIAPAPVPEVGKAPAPAPVPEVGKAPAPAPAPLRYRPRAPRPPAGESGQRTAGKTPEPGETEKESKEYHTVEVFYGTNRKPTGLPQPNDFYGRERHREGPMQYGEIDVSIPLHHTVGVVERPKWYKLEFSEDPEKHVVLLKLRTMEREGFFSAVGEKAESSPKNQALLFIHGFNVSFPSAIQRTAQIAFDLDFEGAALAFCWPSQAALEAYTVDQDNAIWSVPHLSRFLVDLQEQTDLEEIHIIAHSMGTRVLTQALANARDAGFDLTLNNVILAAPDIDADVFREQILPKISGFADRLTMYSSSGDTALKISQKIHGNDRLGLGGPFLKLLDGMDTINATDIDTSLLGHAYYGSHRLVVRDLLNLVVRHLDPPRRDLIKGPLGECEFDMSKAPETTAPPPAETEAAKSATEE